MSARSTDLVQDLVRSGLLSEEKAKNVREKAEQEHLPPDLAVVRAGVMDEAALLDFLSDHYGVATVDLDQVALDPDITALLPKSTAQRYLALPLYKKGRAVVVAMAEAWDVDRVDEVRFSMGREIRPVLAPRDAIRERVKAVYSQTSEQDYDLDQDFLQEALAEMEEAEPAQEESAEAEESTQKLLQESNASPIVKIVNDILIRAIHKGASDIHIEPMESRLGVRLRIDGALRNTMNLPKKAQNAVLSRIKVLSDMDISVSRRPQDGRMKLHYRNRPLDMRVSTLPTFWGEKVVMRILDQSGVGLDLDTLGFLRGEREELERIMDQPQGMLLVTGPTGSGKTTTLYSVLRAINREQTNIITVEDPVEFQLPGINQVPVNPRAGMTFASGLRSILRQDPNVIMVGEIRDQETAEIALESAETGHMVFSTLHTNSAAGAVTRLLDMEIPPYLMAASLSGVLAQRLMRRNCPECTEPAEVDPALRKRYKIPDEVVLYEGKGCQACDGQGKKGRMGAYELLLASAEVREGIYAGASDAELVDRGRRSGMHLMFEDGLIKAMRGYVALSEVLQNLELPAGVEVDAGRLWAEADKAYTERGPGQVAMPVRGTGAEEGERRAVVAVGSHANRHLLETILAGEGYGVSGAGDGQEALALVKQQRPHLLVADAELAELDGLALTRSVRGLPGGRQVAVLLTAQSGDVTRETAAFEAGADDYLVKPLDPERVAARVGHLADLYGRLYGATSA